MRLSIALILSLIIQGCAQKPWYGDLTFKGRFPNKLSEVSGIEHDNRGNLWVIEDNGNKDVLYHIMENAQIIKAIKIQNGDNDDWESLAYDGKEHLYIGDFGNNFNQRKDLKVYIISLTEKVKKGKIRAEKIDFTYPDQEDFPPGKEQMNFDAEGMIYAQEQLFIFSKNRTRPYNGITNIYKIPAKKGSYEAQWVGQMVLCNEQDHCSVTGADLSPDGKTLVLLGYGYLYLITDFPGTDFHKGRVSKIYLNYESQMESVCFKDSTTLFLADEQSKTKGRNLYEFGIERYLNPRKGE